jgi:RNA polymerase sigma-70 factor (ECF subfamily)
MLEGMNPQSVAGDDLGDLRRAAAGDPDGWRLVLDRHRERLRRLAAFRLDRRLWGRVDPSDVVQDALLDAARRLPEFLAEPAVPVFLWLRFLTNQRLATVHRHHLGRELRDAARDKPLDAVDPGDSSAAIAARLADDRTGPSTAAVRAERADRLRTALAALDPTDREVLALRHFEGLTNAETAVALDLTVSGASKRYVRAVERLRAILGDDSGITPSVGGDDSAP